MPKTINVPIYGSYQYLLVIIFYAGFKWFQVVNIHCNSISKRGKKEQKGAIINFYFTVVYSDPNPYHYHVIVMVKNNKKPQKATPTIAISKFIKLHQSLRGQFFHFSLEWFGVVTGIATTRPNINIYQHFGQIIFRSNSHSWKTCQHAGSQKRHIWPPFQKLMLRSNFSIFPFFKFGKNKDKPTSHLTNNPTIAFICNFSKIFSKR